MDRVKLALRFYLDAIDSDIDINVKLEYLYVARKIIDTRNKERFRDYDLELRQLERKYENVHRIDQIH